MKPRRDSLCVKAWAVAWKGNPNRLGREANGHYLIYDMLANAMLRCEGSPHLQVVQVEISPCTKYQTRRKRK